MSELKKKKSSESFHEDVTFIIYGRETWTVSERLKGKGHSQAVSNTCTSLQKRVTLWDYSSIKRSIGIKAEGH